MYQDDEYEYNCIYWNYNPNHNFHKLKEKLLKGRRDREEAKKKAKKREGSSELELSDLVGSLAIGSNTYNMSNVWDLTYYAFQD